MIKYGNKDLRKRWKGNVNVNTIHLGTTNIWPYITNVNYGDWKVNISTSTIPASGGTITVTSVTRNIVYTWVNFVGTTNTRYTTTETETITDFTLSSSVGSVNGHNVIVPYNPNTSDRNVVITVTLPTGGQVQTTVVQTKNVVTYSAWNLTLSVSPTSISSSGGTATITSSCTRTYTNSNGQPGGTETSAVNLSTNVGSISGTTLTVPANSDTSTKSITVTATAQGLTKTASLSQAGATVATTKYYAVVTDAYSVSLNGQTKTVPYVGESGPTSSYYHGTIVFSVESGASSYQASFGTNNVSLGGNEDHVFIAAPFVTNAKYDAGDYVFIIGGNRTSKILKMTAPSSISLTGYDTEAAAIQNAKTAYSTITQDTSITTANFDAIATNIRGDSLTKLDEFTDDYGNFRVYNLKYNAVTSNNSRKLDYKYGSITGAYSSFFAQHSSLGTTMMPHGFCYADAYNYNIPNSIALFASPPSSSNGIKHTPNNTEMKSYSGTITNDAISGDSIRVNTGKVYAADDASTTVVRLGETIYIYEWVEELQDFIKLGEYVYEENIIKVFAYKHGVANSLKTELVLESFTNGNQVYAESDYVLKTSQSSVSGEQTFFKNAKIYFEHKTNGSKMLVDSVTADTGQIYSIEPDTSVGPNPNQSKFVWHGLANMSNAAKTITYRGTNNSKGVSGKVTVNHKVPSTTAYDNYWYLHVTNFNGQDLNTATNLAFDIVAMKQGVVPQNGQTNLVTLMGYWTGDVFAHNSQVMYDKGGMTVNSTTNSNTTTIVPDGSVVEFYRKSGSTVASTTYTKIGQMVVDSTKSKTLDCITGKVYPDNFV